MKNKINKILLIISYVLAVLILFLAILGSVERIGYLSEFKLNEELSKKDAYFYDFRIKYYSKIFRNSDIYKVSFQIPGSVYINGEPILFRNINFDEKGVSPFADFVSPQKLEYDYKINGITYTLKLKFPVYIIFIIALLCILYIKLIAHINLLNNEKLLLKIYKISSISILAILILLFIFGKIKHKAVFEDLELLEYTEAGYVYKARIANNGLFSPNIIYNGFDKLLILKNKPGYIKNYGYSLELHNPDWYNGKIASIYSNSDGTFTISNNVSEYMMSYKYGLELSKGEKYILILETKKLDTNIDSTDTFKYHLNGIYNIEVTNKYKMEDGYEKSVSELNIKNDNVYNLGLRLYFPKGVFSLKSIKIKQVSDDLYLKSGNTIMFTSSKNIDDVNNLDFIYYKLKYNKYLFILIIALILLLYKMMTYDKKIYNILIQRKEIIKNTSIILIILFIFIIILTALLGKKDRTGYLSDFNIILSNNGEYTYGFKIKYYSKIFRNGNIYDVYTYLNNLPEYVKSAKMNDRFGTPYGSLTSTKELKYDDKIDIKYYLMMKFDIFYYIAIIMIIILLCIGYYFLKEYWKYKKNLDKNDYMFINKVELLGGLLFAFHYWLFYPGFIGNFDTWISIINALYNMSDNWHPVLLDLSIKFIDKIGLTMSSFLFISLFLWYVSISIIIISIYVKTKNKLSILLFAISFIKPIFLHSIEYLKDPLATLYITFSYSIVFFIVFFPLKNRNRRILKIISLVSLIIGMLHRHNFIVTVYPILIWFTYDYLKSKNIKNIRKYLFCFIGIMLINAIVLMAIYFIFPRIFIKNINKAATYHLYYLQIAGCIVPANDASLIPNNFWGKGKSFKDLSDQYNKNPFFADPIRNNGILVAFRYPSELKKVWIKSILKYPKNYIKHMFNYTKAMWTLKYQFYTFGGRYPHEKAVESRKIDLKVLKNTKFYKENQGMEFTELKRSILNSINNLLPNINVFFFILISIILFFVSGIFLLLKKEFRTDMLVLTFSVSFSAVVTAVIVALFTPITDYRYIHPVIPITIIALIGFILFIYDIGGVKKLIKRIKDQ